MSKIRHTVMPLAALALSLAVTPAMASSSSLISGVDVLKTWNLVVLGNLNSSSEVEGRTFVGGNLTGNSSNYNIRALPASPTDTPGLTVVGNVTGSHKNLNNGSGAVIGGNVNSGFNLNGSPQTVLVGGSISNTNVNSNTVKSGLSSSDPAFSQNLTQQKSLIETSMGNLSYSMSTETANSTLGISGNRGTFNSKPNADGVAVFNISSGDLDKIGEIQFNLNGADTVVVNVSGPNINLNDNFLGGTNNLGEHVIWNFYEAKNLSLSTAWGGSVLAPNATASTSNYIQGSAVFGNLQQNGEFHIGTYTGGYIAPTGSSSSTSTSTGSSSSSSSGGGTAVPEPGMLALFGAALAGLFFWQRRRKLA